MESIGAGGLVAFVIDAYSRRVIGWSIADHMKTSLVSDALGTATTGRRPQPGHTMAHSDHGAQYTSRLFGQRIRTAGLLGSIGPIGDCFDNSVVESFFSTLQLELRDQQPWPDQTTLGRAMFDWIEAWYNPRRRHSQCNYLSPIEYETTHAA